MKQTYLFANWKMYLDYQESIQLVKKLNELEFNQEKIKMVVCPGDLAIKDISEQLSDKINLGAQSGYWVDKGGYTGEISMQMYRDIGCKYVLIGHSERRHQFNESDEDVRKKMEAALATGLTPILCVGETLAQREKGLTVEIVNIQLKKALQKLPIEPDRELIIAYEPVWAIGTGHSCTVRDAEVEHKKIDAIVRAVVKNDPVILYGGSVRSENVLDYISSPEINGVLVGGASTKIDSWKEIVNKCQKG